MRSWLTGASTHAARQKGQREDERRERGEHTCIAGTFLALHRPPHGNGANDEQHALLGEDEREHDCCYQRPSLRPRERVKPS